MNKQVTLKKVNNYTHFLSLFFLVLAVTLGIVSTNVIPALIALSLFVILVFASNVLDLYLYYLDLELEKGAKKWLVLSLFLDAISWLLIAIIFFVRLFSDPSFAFEIIMPILVVISSFAAIAFADFENDKHNKTSRIVICLLYTLDIILTCALTL